MKFSEPLGHFWITRRMPFEYVFRLVLEMIEIGIWWEASYRHRNFLSYARGPHLQAESKFVKTNCSNQVDFCPFRGPDAPFCASVILPRWLCPKVSQVPDGRPTGSNPFHPSRGPLAAILPLFPRRV
jgi:hypothetical protein